MGAIQQVGLALEPRRVQGAPAPNVVLGRTDRISLFDQSFGEVRTLAAIFQSA